jgi:hypothetical protein
MNPTTEKWLWTAGIGIACLFCGFISGTTYAGRNFSPEDTAVTVDRAVQQETDKQDLLRLRLQESQLLANEKDWQARVTSCEANFQGETILTEPGPPLTVPVLRGAINLQAGPALGLPTGNVARWVLPAKIVPRAVGNVPGLQYVHIDGHTQLIEGPYAALPIQQGERYNVTGWVSQ